MLRFHFFTAKQGTWVHKDDRGPLPEGSLVLRFLVMFWNASEKPIGILRLSTGVRQNSGCL